MVAISVSVDRRAALLAGHDLGNTVVIDVTPETIGTELWPVLVADLLVTTDPPSLQVISVSAPTPEAVRDALIRRWDAHVAKNVEALAKLRAAIAETERMMAATPTIVQLYIEPPYPPLIMLNSKYPGYRRELPRVSSHPASMPSTFDADQRAEWMTLIDRYDAVVAQNNAELATLNAAALEAALPEMRAAYIANQASVAAEKAVTAQRQAALCKARLESGYWEHKVLGYNDRRYGAPWCARITGIEARGNLAYAFGDSTARHGSSGLLRVACKPGEIIAWGQKDNRRPDSSEHHILQMQNDGSMNTIDRTEAYRQLTKTA
jgi:hypothetical protein